MDIQEKPNAICLNSSSPSLEFLCLIIIARGCVELVILIFVQKMFWHNFAGTIHCFRCNNLCGATDFRPEETNYQLSRGGSRGGLPRATQASLRVHMVHRACRPQLECFQDKVNQSEQKVSQEGMAKVYSMGRPSQAAMEQKFSQNFQKNGESRSKHVQTPKGARECEG